MAISILGALVLLFCAVGLRGAIIRERVESHPVMRDVLAALEEEKDFTRYAMVELIGDPPTGVGEKVPLMVEAFGKQWSFDLSPVQLVSPDYKLEVLDSEGILQPIASSAQSDQYFIGRNTEDGGESISLRISDDGVTHGTMFNKDGIFHIKHLKQSDKQLHVIYEDTGGIKPTLGVEGYSDIQAALSKRLSKRRIGVEEHVDEVAEMLVVVDHNSVQYNGKGNVEQLVIKILGTVANMYGDPSLGGPPIRISLVRLVLENGGDIVSSGRDIKTVLDDFSEFQFKKFSYDASDTRHHDFAVFLTRRNMCQVDKTGYCSTHVVGLAPVYEMCDPRHSCVVIEDRGLSSSFILAHEMGHSLGMLHDGPPHNNCPSEGFIMAAVSGGHGKSSYLWSNCSAESLRLFRGAGGTSCLRDPPDNATIDIGSLPGFLDNGNLQCRLMFGPWASVCTHTSRHKSLDVCSQLWCRNSPKTCVSNRLPAVDGTFCNVNILGISSKICYHGECIHARALGSPIDGGWGDWNEWSTCSKTCGGGVATRKRECNNPIPKFGGNFCEGKAIEAQYCSPKPCPGGDTYRNEQCKQHRKLPFNGKFYKWEAIENAGCTLVCRAGNKVAFLGILKDGTSCVPSGKFKHAVCVTGECKNVGYDGNFNGSIIELSQLNHH